MATCASDIIGQIRSFASQKFRHEFPYMKTATLEDMLDEATNKFSKALLKQQAEMEDTKTRTNFFSLSAELRNKIYELTLVENRVIEIDAGNTTPPRILATNRRVCKEARSIYYGMNTFRWYLKRPTRDLPNITGFKAWLDYLDQEEVESLTDIELVFPASMPRPSNIFRAYIDAETRQLGNAPLKIMEDGLSLHERMLQLMECSREGVSASTLKVMYHNPWAIPRGTIPVMPLSDKVRDIDVNKKLTREEFLEWLKGYE